MKNCFWKPSPCVCHLEMRNRLSSTIQYDLPESAATKKHMFKCPNRKETLLAGFFLPKTSLFHVLVCFEFYHWFTWTSSWL